MPQFCLFVTKFYVLTQAASNPPMAIRCERSYVFSVGGHHTGDTILTFNLGIV